MFSEADRLPFSGGCIGPTMVLVSYLFPKKVSNSLSLAIIGPIL